jgi:hypothetical protein
MRTTPTPESEHRLTEALREWVVDMPLPPRFEEGVWRRISRTETQPQTGLWVRALRSLSESFARPKVAYAYITILLVFGMAAGSWTAQVKSSRLETALGERYVGSVDPYQFALPSSSR